MKTLLLLGLVLLAGPARAAFQNVFFIGSNNATQTEFEQENTNLTNYYWENGNYTPLGGENWAGGQEVWNNGVAGDTVGFARALTTGYTQTNVFFVLDATESAVNQPVRLTIDIIALGGGSVHDLDVRLNGSAAFASRTGIAGDQTWVITTTAGAMGAVTGPNVLRIRRTGGAGGASPWIQFDYVQMEADPAPQYINTFTATPPSSAPGQAVTLAWNLFQAGATVSINQGVGDVTGITSGGVGNFVVNPLTTTTYTLSVTFNSITQTRPVTVTIAPFITAFTGSDPLLRPGETCTLAWTINPAVLASVALSINQGIGTVTAPGGTGSTVVTPSANTTYTLSAVYSGITQAANVVVNASPYYAIFEAGLDNASNAELSHEVAADDNYYFAGDYTSVGGPNQGANESLNDDTDTNTVPGRTGNPTIGFERAVTEFDAHLNVWFIPNPAHVNVTSVHRITVDVLSVDSVGGGTQSHNMEILLNDVLVRTETAIAAARNVQFELTGLNSGLHTGPNKLTIRRTGGTPDGYIVFDHVMMEYLPTTAPAITGVTSDPILGTRTVAWTSVATRTYRVQKSTDAGTTWTDLAAGLPTGGAPSTSLFFEDRVTPFADPTPSYRILTE